MERLKALSLLAALALVLLAGWFSVRAPRTWREIARQGDSSSKAPSALPETVRQESKPLEPARPRLGQPTLADDVEAPAVAPEADLPLQLLAAEPPVAGIPEADVVQLAAGGASTSVPAALPPRALRWESSRVLLQQLDTLGWDCECAGFAAHCTAQLRDLSDATVPAPVASGRLHDLELAVERADVLAGQVHSLDAAQRLRQFAYALSRRLPLWRLALTSAEPQRAATCAALAELERYEVTQLPSDGAALRLSLADLASAEGSEMFWQWSESHFRNANLRVAVTETLLNRLAPRPAPQRAPVRDRFLGVPSQGWSWTAADVSVDLLPDPHQWRLSLHARGQIFARTRSESGPAVIGSETRSQFEVDKPFALGPRGLSAGPTQADVDSRTRLASLRTDFDGIPLIGWLINDLAAARYEETQPLVRAHVRRRVQEQAAQQVDAAAATRLREIEGRMQDEVLSPLTQLGLQPHIVEMASTDDRLTLRLRLATDEQLAAHTPRPRAPAGALASVQLHQSALNNLLGRLELAGRTFTLPKLQEHLAAKLQFTEPLPPLDVEHAVEITFAAEDPLCLRLADGRVELTLALARLQTAERRWDDLHVRVFYRPIFNGLQLSFVRDGTVQLPGRRLPLKAQLAVRGIFSKAFPADRPLHLTSPEFQARPMLAGLGITQFVLRDGWLSLALGETTERTVSQPARRVARTRE